MTEHLPSSEPRFNVDSWAPDDIRERLLSLEARIKESPLQFQVLFSKMGDIALNFAPPEDVEVDGDDISRVRWYFDEREDQYVGFDAETEQSVKVNRRFKELEQNRIRAENGNSKSAREEVRDQIRLFRLQHFAGRAVAWQELQTKRQEAQSVDPKAELNSSTVDLPYPNSGEDKDLLNAS